MKPFQIDFYCYIHLHSTNKYAVQYYHIHTYTHTYLRLTIQFIVTYTHFMYLMYIEMMMITFTIFTYISRLCMYTNSSIKRFYTLRSKSKSSKMIIKIKQNEMKKENLNFDQKILLPSLCPQNNRDRLRQVSKVKLW